MLSDQHEEVAILKGGSPWYDLCGEELKSLKCSTFVRSLVSGKAQHPAVVSSALIRGILIRL